jgi:hypothetical protein
VRVGIYPRRVLSFSSVLDWSAGHYHAGSAPSPNARPDCAALPVLLHHVVRVHQIACFLIGQRRRDRKIADSLDTDFSSSSFCMSVSLSG